MSRITIIMPLNIYSSFLRPGKYLADLPNIAVLLLENKGFGIPKQEIFKHSF